MNNFKIPKEWREDFISRIAGTCLLRAVEHGMSPEFIFNNNGKWECIITPETDLTNPFILELIQSQQKSHAGDPPKPIEDKNDSRKLDWRPVYEWRKAHPSFTIQEIAQKIGYKPQTVRKKLSELESRK